MYIDINGFDNKLIKPGAGKSIDSMAIAKNQRKSVSVIDCEPSSIVN